jgi:hypothetical protein
MPISITKPDVGASEDSWGDLINTALDAIVLEINSNADGTNAITPNLTEGSWEISTTPVTASAADLNAIDGFAATSVTVAELGYLSGATSNIQNQIDTINAASGSGTVTSVAMSVPTGLTVSGSPITTSGTLAVSLQSGYSIPTTSSQSNWDTAFGWGDHSTQGYLTSAPAPTTAQVGTATAGLAADAVGSYCWGRPKNTTAYSLGGTTNALFAVQGGNAYWSNPNNTFYDPTHSGTAMSGTWRCMSTTSSNSSGLWLKIAS